MTSIRRLRRRRDIAQPRSTNSQRSYRHEAFLWHDAEEFLAVTVPFIQGAVEAREPVMVAVIPARTEALKDALGADAEEVMFVDMVQLGRNPARIIPAWRQFLDSHLSANLQVRGIGEPIWPGRRAEEIVEVQLHEALLNVAIDPNTPFWLMCPYDAGQLDSSVLEEAQRSHPAIVDVTDYRGSTLYEGRSHVDAMFGSELPPLSGQSVDLVFGRDDLRSIASLVALHAFAAGVRADRAGDLAAAVQQLAAGSLHRGARGGLVRIWTRSEAIICEVRDSTKITDPLVGRRLANREGSNGLWVANQLCDLVQLRSTVGGTTVRVHHWFEG
jgi:hypothetical protein